MPIPVVSSFSLKGKFPIDERMIFDTIEAMKTYSTSFLPDMYFCFVKEDQNLYIYSTQNDDDPNTGKWRVFEGGSGSSERYKYDQLDPSNVWSIHHGLNETIPSNIICINDNGDEIFGDVEYISNNMLKITFNESLKGTCIVVK